MTVRPFSQPAGDGRHDRALLAMLAWYLLVWLATAIAPFDRRDWLLENILAVALVTVLVGTYRRFRFSLLSYGLITVFLTVHAIAAHYTYTLMPVGAWTQEAFGLGRNHFDRLTHFLFGLLMIYSMRELLVRRAGLFGIWSAMLPLALLLALSWLYEIVESWVAQIVSPELGDAYLGTQGDIWDAQKDMTAALTGALLGLALTAASRRLLPPKVAASIQ